MQNYLTQITNYLLTQSWQIAVLVVVIAVASLAVKNKSAHVRYLLWLIVLAKCLVPPLLTVPLAILPQGQQAEPVLTTSVEMPTVTVEAVVDTAVSEPLGTVPSAPLAAPTIAERLAEVTIHQWLAFAWIIGATVFVFIAVIKALRVNSWLRRDRRLLSAELQTGIENLFSDLGIRAFPKVWLVDGIGQPFVWGLLRGSIYLPSDFSRLDSRENRRSVLVHELSHIMRFDAAVNVLQIIAQAVFWFHPFVWWANKKIRAEREKCCDEMAIARLGAKAKDYSTAIVNTLIVEHELRHPVPSLAVAGPVKNIEDRIKTIMNPGKKFYKRPSVVVVIAVLLLALIVSPTTLALTARPRDKMDVQVEGDYSSVIVEEGVGFDDIIVGDANCTRGFIISKLGKPDKEVKDEKDWWLNYGDKYGLGFWVNKKGILREIRLNKGFKGKLTSGISMSSAKEDVFNVYGQPIKKETARDFDERFENEVLFFRKGSLFRKSKISKIYYNRYGLLFWFDGDRINQIVIFPKLEKTDVSVEGESNIDVLDVEFEPIRKGKNVVRVNVQNTSEKDQTFAIHIYTRSPDYGRQGVGWGRPFFDEIGAGETKWMRFAFHIQGPITDNTWLRLKFYNPESVEAYDYEKPFKQKRYASSELEHRKADEGQAAPVSKSQATAIIEVFEKIQGYIKDEKYEQAWELFARDYRDAVQINSLEKFKKRMEPRSGFNLFYWEKSEFLALKPGTVFVKDNLLRLKAVYEGQEWTIDFAQEAGQWKIGWIAGYTPRILLWQNWEQRLLPTMKKRSTKHFDIYYYKDSTAEKEIDQIVEQKEKGFAEICQFLGKDSDVRICMVFFEDGKTKKIETGHQGAGWAYGNTIVEVYNEEQKLDPYHETTHVLMRPYGNPPALFNEGFATYMSERLGAHGLKSLGGGQSSIYQRVRELKSKNEWIPLEELITYTDIGPGWSRPPVAYPEAASFVKYLIDTYGEDKFLQAYKQLQNSGSKQVQEKNIEKLTNIYGKSLQQLEKQWEDAFLPPQSRESAEKIEPKNAQVK